MSPPCVFIGLTVITLGFAAFMTGKALANTWKPLWQLFVYTLLLGVADRFLAFALFEGELLSLAGFLLDTAALLALSLFAFRLTRATKMVRQYPWRYERSGWLSWREK